MSWRTRFKGPITPPDGQALPDARRYILSPDAQVLHNATWALALTSFLIRPACLSNKQVLDSVPKAAGNRTDNSSLKSPNLLHTGLLFSTAHQYQSSPGKLVFACCTMALMVAFARANSSSLTYCSK